MDPLLLVVGSVNYDLIFRHTRLPRPGETVSGAVLTESCGGKGANQAVAAARCARRRGLALRVAFAGAVGEDAYGSAQREVFARDEIDTTWLRVIRGANTGLSAVWVDSRSGENRILNSPGANRDLTSEALADLPVESAALVLLQNEIPPHTCAFVAAKAASASVPVIWNPAPFAAGDKTPIAPQTLRFLTPNEVEAEALLGTGVDARRPETAALGLQALGYGGVVLTLGARGAVVCARAGAQVETVSAPRIEAVDTTGAGDAFNGAFAAGLVAGMEVADAVRFGVEYASESVGLPGTQSSFPGGS